MGQIGSSRAGCSRRIRGSAKRCCDHPRRHRARYRRASPRCPGGRLRGNYDVIREMRFPGSSRALRTSTNGSARRRRSTFRTALAIDVLKRLPGKAVFSVTPIPQARSRCGRVSDDDHPIARSITTRRFTGSTIAIAARLGGRQVQSSSIPTTIREASLRAEQLVDISSVTLRVRRGSLRGFSWFRIRFRAVVRQRTTPRRTFSFDSERWPRRATSR